MKVVVVRHCRHVTKNWADMAVFYQKMCACVSETVSVYKKEEDVMKVSVVCDRREVTASSTALMLSHLLTSQTLA